MIYLIGGAPRVGKTVLAQQVSVLLKIGWISTDVLHELLKVCHAEDPNGKWNADKAAISATAERFFPYLERFIWGIQSLADAYVIEGVNFLPAQVARLPAQFQIRPIFLGCSKMTLDRFERFPGRSKGYIGLPDEMRRQIVQDVPLWSEFIREEAGRYGYPYIGMSDDFQSRLKEAEAVLTASVD